MFYDHPLLGLYFLGDASDGSSSGQLAFAGTSVCSGAGNPGNLNAITIFQGLPINQPSAANPCAATLNPGTASALGFLPNQQQFQRSELSPIGFSQPELSEPVHFLPLGFQPFGYPQAKNFVYAYSQQANLTVEQRSRPRFRSQSCLQLQWRTTSEPSHQRQHDSRRLDGRELQRSSAMRRSGQATPASPFTVSGCSRGGPTWRRSRTLTPR